MGARPRTHSIHIACPTRPSREHPRIYPTTRTDFTTWEMDRPGGTTTRHVQYLPEPRPDNQTLAKTLLQRSPRHPSDIRQTATQKTPQTRAETIVPHSPGNSSDTHRILVMPQLGSSPRYASDPRQDTTQTLVKLSPRHSSHSPLPQALLRNPTHSLRHSAKASPDSPKKHSSNTSRKSPIQPITRTDVE